MKYKDYYQIMGVEKDATQDEIKRAYRRLARKFHPDVSSEEDAEEQFKEVGEAYEVLKDVEKRAAYDQLGSGWKTGEEFKPPPDWNQGFEFHDSEFSASDASQFSDFFESLFGHREFGKDYGDYGRRTQGAYHAHGEDTHAKIFIDLEDAYVGTTRSLTLKHSQPDDKGRPTVKERTLKVRIPKGVHQGQHIRLPGQGSAGIGSGRAGDLYLQIEFQQHPFYHVEGKDVYLQLPVTPWEAGMGATVNVPTPSGAVELKIPANSNNGQKLRLKGRGIPAKQAGNFYVIINIQLPQAKNDQETLAYQDFKKAFTDFNPRSHLGVKAA